MKYKKSHITGKPSKGCERCRRQKVKCDEEKPHCQRCLRRNVACKYRDFSEVLFHDETNNIAQQYRGSSSSTSQDPSNIQEDSFELQVVVGKPRQNETVNIHFNEAIKSVHRISSGDALTRDSILSLFTRYCMPERYVSDRGCLYPPARFSVLTNLGKYEGKWTPTPFAISALAYTRCYHLTGDINMLRKGMEYYQLALRSIRLALTRHATTFSADTIMAIAVVGIYEALDDSTSHKGEAHATAFVNLIRLMGPEKMQEDPLHEVFNICRLYTISQSLVTRHHTFFADQEWCTVPWYTRTKNIYQSIMDETAQICTHLEFHDALGRSRSSPTNILKSRIDLQAKLITQRESLLSRSPLFPTIFDQMTSMNAVPLKPPSLIQSSIPFCYSYRSLSSKSLEAAECYLLYCTTSLIISMTLKENNDAILVLLSNKFTSTPNSSDPASGISATSSIASATASSSTGTFPPTPEYSIPSTTSLDYEHAMAITRSMEYFLQNEKGLFGAAASGPMQTALDWFATQSDCGAQLKWANEILGLLTDYHANRLRRGIRLKE